MIISGPNIKEQVDRLAADGRITQGDAATIAKFSEFLELMGPPRKPDDPRPGETVADRLTRLGRQDLLNWARGSSAEPGEDTE